MSASGEMAAAGGDAGAAEDDGTRRPLSRMRRAIAASMTLSAQVPQFTLDPEVTVDVAGAFRSRLQGDGLSVSWEDLLVAACARALRLHPNVNSSFDEDAIIEHPEIHVGLATSVPGGLLTPAIRNADRRSLHGLANERRRLRSGAAEGSLRGAELFGATFTVSNLGPYGVDRFRALVIPPQAAILACGRVATTAEGPRLSLALSCDHRVLDGAPAAEFLATVCGHLEEPDWLETILSDEGS